MRTVKFRLGKKQLNIGLFLLLILFRIETDFIYRKIISVYYRYAGFTCAPTTMLDLVSWAILLASYPALKLYYENRTEKLSFELLLFLYIMSFVPFTSMVSAGVLQTTFIVSNTAYWFIIFLLSRAVLNSVRIWRFGESRKRLPADMLFKGIAILSILVILYISARYAGFRIILDFGDVYGYRAEAKLNSLPRVLTYLFSWTRLLNIVLLGYFIDKKKYLWVFALIMAQVLSFGYDGMKATLFATILIIGLSLFRRFKVKSINHLILVLLVAFEAVCILQFRLTKEYSLSSLFVRRGLFIPVQISSFYVDYFTKNTPDFFRASFLRFFGFQTPYPNLGNLIAGVYQNRPAMNSNNGLISDAYTNFGRAGIVIMPVLLIFLFRLLDDLTEYLNMSVLIPLTIVLASSFINSFVMTILLTHGLAVIMLMFYFVHNDNDLRRYNQR